MGSYSIFDVFLLIDLIMETQCWVIKTEMRSRPQSRPNPPPPS